MEKLIKKMSEQINTNFGEANKTVDIILNDLSENLKDEVAQITETRRGTLRFRAVFMDALPICLEKNDLSNEGIINVVKDNEEISRQHDLELIKKFQSEVFGISL